MSETSMDTQPFEMVIFVLGAKTDEKTSFLSRLYNPASPNLKLAPGDEYSKPFAFEYRNGNVLVIDTPRLENSRGSSKEILRIVSNMFEHHMLEKTVDQEKNQVPVFFSVVYCHAVTTGQLSPTTRHNLQALASLCMHFDFLAFAILPVISSPTPTELQIHMRRSIREHPDIKDIYTKGGVLLEFEPNPDSVVNYLISKAITSNIAQGVDSVSRRSELDTGNRDQNLHRSRAQELEIERLKLELKTAKESYEDLISSLALPANNLELKSLSDDFDNINRDISSLVKAISKHFKAERGIGVDKLLAGQAKLDAMHKALPNDQEDRASVSLFHSETNQHMSVKLFVQNAAALIICEALHMQIFQPFYPGLEPSMNKRLGQMYESVQKDSNETMSGIWRRKTFLSLHETEERAEEVLNTISVSIKNSIGRFIRILFTGSEPVITRQQAPLSDFERVLAPIDKLVRRAFKSNQKIKTEAILIGTLRTLYYSPGTTFDPFIMKVDGAKENQENDRTLRREGVRNKKNRILSTFGLGLELSHFTETNAGERAQEITIVNHAIVTDPSSRDISY